MPHTLLATAVLSALALAPTDIGPADGGTEVRVELPAISFESLSTGSLSHGALDSDGRLWTWGRNAAGELLRADAESPAAPAPVTDPAAEGLVQVAFGEDYALAITEDGTVLTWGRELTDRLDSDDIAAPDPVEALEIELPSAAVQVVTGADTAYALLDDGTVWAWPIDDADRTDEGITDQPEPSQIALPGPATTVVTGADTAAALGADGTVHTWAGAEAEPTPEPVDLGGATATQLAAGTGHLVALTDTGLLAWGDNAYGQLGTGTTDPAATPVHIDLPATPATLIAGGDNTAVLDTEGQLWVWGDNIVGTIGDGSTGLFQRTPTPAAAPEGVRWTEASIHALTVFALDEAGQLWGWGLNDARQLGIDQPMTVPTPTPVDLGLTVTDVTFDGGSAVTLEQVDATTALATTPRHEPGTVDVVVTALDRNGDPVPPRVLRDGFTYQGRAATEKDDALTVESIRDPDIPATENAPVPTATAAAAQETSPTATPTTTDPTTAVPPPQTVRNGLATTGLPFAIAVLAGLTALGGGGLLLRWLRTVIDPLDR